MGFCRDHMTTPIMIHSVVGLDDWGDGYGHAAFETEGFVRRFKRGFEQYLCKLNKSRPPEIRTRKNIPDLQLFYSIESKYTKITHPEDGIPPFLHMHIMIIADKDNNRYGFTELNNAINDSLFRIEGIKPPDDKQNLGALKMRDKYTSVRADDTDFSERRYHDLKTEFNDAICRASYLCKLDQKDLLPKRFKQQSFGRTKLKNHSSNDRASIELEAVTIAMIDAILNEGLRDTLQDTSSKLLRKVSRRTKQENQHHQIELDFK
jgi:hypothetical protein